MSHLRHFSFVYTKNTSYKNTPRRPRLVVFHWFYKGWSHFGPLFRPVFFKYVGLRNRICWFRGTFFQEWANFHWFYNRISNFLLPISTRNHILDRFYKGFLIFLSIESQYFGQKSSFSIGFTIESAMTDFIYLTQSTVFLWFYTVFFDNSERLKVTFWHESAFFIGFTIESAVSLEHLFVHFRINFGPFWDVGPHFRSRFLPET